MAKAKQKSYTKVIDEQFIVSSHKGGGMIKFEAWQDDGCIVKYSMAYINRAIYPHDNGRVVGYDNAHDFHHKHFFGEITPVDDFVDYQEMVLRFKNDIKEYIQ